MEENMYTSIGIDRRSRHSPIEQHIKSMSKVIFSLISTTVIRSAVNILVKERNNEESHTHTPKKKPKGMKRAEKYCWKEWVIGRLRWIDRWDRLVEQRHKNNSFKRMYRKKRTHFKWMRFYIYTAIPYLTVYLLSSHILTSGIVCTQNRTMRTCIAWIAEKWKM